MLTGRVVQFNQVRGYGFIAPDSGGDDVFLHAEEIKGLPEAALVGTRVEFQVIEGQRGLKAFDVKRIADDKPSSNGGGNGAVAAAVTEDDLSEVISARQYIAEITDVLIATCPEMTAGQIVAIRDRLVAAARKRRWIDD